MSCSPSDSQAGITVYSLNRDEVHYLIGALQNSKVEVLVGTDPIDDAFKFKIDGGIWSPPIGRGK
jgi:hypothetical protein